MKLLRAPSRAEVLAASPQDTATLVETVQHNYGLYEATLTDIASIRAQHPDETQDTIAALEPSWRATLASPEYLATPKGRKSRDSYDRLCAVLAAGEPFHFPPILLRAVRQVHDGRHRLFAAYAARHTRPDLVVPVYWGL